MAATQQGGAETGVVVRLLPDKGFGFIRGDDNVERFFHRSSVKGATFEALVAEQTRVSFIPSDGEKGPRAEQVRLV